MKYLTALVAAMAAATVSAAPTYGERKPVEHIVTVGGKGLLRYTPDHVEALPGDTIKFVFKQQNHTVTESSFNAPCRKLSDSAYFRAFDTGFVPNIDDKVNPPPTKTLHIKDTRPRFFYCRQSNHCGQGMVLTVNVNPKGPMGIEKFRQRAIQQNGGKIPKPDQAPPALWGDALLKKITDGFDKTGNTGMVFDYASNGFGPETTGTDLSKIDTSKVPRFSLCGSCANAPGNKFIIAMIDVDAAKPRLHYLRTDFDTLQQGAAPEDLVSKTKPIVPYKGPETTKSEDGKKNHRYVFVQIDQPKNFKIDMKTVQEENFDLYKFYSANDLKPAQGGAFFLKQVGATAPPTGNTY